MADQNEQQLQAETEVQTPAGQSDEIALLKASIQKLEANSRKQMAELTSARERLAAKDAEDQEALQAKLIADGKSDVIINELRQTVDEKKGEIAELKKQISDQNAAFTASQVQNVALNAFAQAGAHTPADLYALEREKLELKDGNVVAVVGGVHTPLDEYVQGLRAPGSNRAYHFAGTGARGMSAQGSAPSTAGGRSWSELSFTEQLQVEVDDLEKGTNNAARLKAAG